MAKANENIKGYAKGKGVKLYEVAGKLGISPQEFSVAFMRNPMAKETERRVRLIIDAIANERKAE